MMDLTQTPTRQRLDLKNKLRQRLAVLLGVQPSDVGLFACSKEVERATGLIEEDTQNLIRLGILALETIPQTQNFPALMKLGTFDSPIYVLVACNAPNFEMGEVHIRTLVGVLDQLTPAGLKLAIEAEKARLTALKPICAFFSEFMGEDKVSITESGLTLTPVNVPEFEKVLIQNDLSVNHDDGVFELALPTLERCEALARHLGLHTRTRQALVRRKTKETDIAVRVDLDGTGTQADTGIEFFDHMLDQVARHGGFGLEVVCEGDLGIDAHHSIEDVCLALGEALREALGDKRGIGRFGFALPMDETRASVWIDVSGRPFIKFEGDIPTEKVGDFPVEMTAHAFRSLSESLKASIHVSVEGENAHHMIEACFKAFGRALRQAVRVEGHDLPSTKGML